MQKLNFMHYYLCKSHFWSI